MSKLIKIYETDKMPDYIACYFEYGDLDNLTEEDIKNADNWLNRIEENHGVKGVTFEWGEETGFYYYPEFGLGCNCINVKVWANK